ncbi:MAG: oligosaccharide flippase family protein [Bacteroidales bacterium]|nr:oligosaccharide flippase family protein [Bacteroidales bacterium]
MAQAVALIIYPILTRLFSADDFGLFNLFLSIGGILVLLATAQYEYSIPLPRSHRQASWCLQSALPWLCIVVAVCVAVLPFSKGVATIFDAPRLADVLWLLPIYVAAISLWELLRFWAVRWQRFDRVSTYQVDQAVLNAGMKVGAGYVGMGSGLIYASVLAPLMALLITMARLPRRLLGPLFHVERRGVRAAMRRYRNFPFFSLPRTLIDNLSGNLPLLVMAPAFGLSTVGFVGMALTLSFRPINIICNSLNQVFYQRTSLLVQQRKPLAYLCRQYVIWAAAVAVPGFAALYFVLPWLCGWLLGDEWTTTGHFIRIMLPWLFMILIDNAINFIPDIFDRQRGTLVFAIVCVSLQVVALFVGVALGSPMLTVGLYFSIAAVNMLVKLFWYRSILKRYESSL